MKRKQITALECRGQTQQEVIDKLKHVVMSQKDFKAIWRTLRCWWEPYFRKFFAHVEMK